ncbi:MAG: hypothetical protein ACRD0U_09485 [Acidimicrobiales bacterium]
MSRTDPSPTTAATLGALAAMLDDASEADGWRGPPLLVRLTAGPRPDAFDLGLRPLDDFPSAIDALLGLTAPTEWAAIGVVAEGDAWNEPAGAANGTGPRRVRVVHLVDRTGTAAWSVRAEGEEPTRSTTSEIGDGAEGRIDDACRRALGCATPPPTASTLELWAALWLDATLATAASTPDWCPTWADVAALHPALTMLAGDGGLRAGDADHLPSLGRVLTRARPWEHLRRCCADGAWSVPFLSAAHADWMDEGMFSRWLLDGLPPVGELASAVCDLLPGRVTRRLRSVLCEWALGP